MGAGGAGLLHPSGREVAHSFVLGPTEGVCCHRITKQNVHGGR